MPSSGPQVNYFPSFQTLSAISHADSLAKFVCASQWWCTSHREAQSCEPVNKVKKNIQLYKVISQHNKNDFSVSQYFSD
jgi:hypothetical protein